MKKNTMKKLSIYTHQLTIGITIFVTLSILTITIISDSMDSYAENRGIEFYSLDSMPVGMNSLEPLIANWWNWWEDHPASMANNWPECFKGDGGIIGNNSIVFLADPALAVESNVNSRNQECTISSNQLLYLTVYPGECSTGSKPHEGEYPETKSTADLLQCAQDSNKVIKKMQVKVDGNDVSDHIIRQSTTQPFNFIIKSDNSDNWGPPIANGNNTSMAENYYLFLKPLSIGDHTIDLEVIRQPIQANQPVEHDIAKWNIKVIDKL